MIDTLEYKGRVGSIEFSREDNLLFGKILGVRGLYSYEGASVEELTEDFRRAVDELEAGGARSEKASAASLTVV